MPVVAKRSTFQQIQPGTYYSILTRIEEKTIPDGKGGEVHGAEWQFTIGSDGPHKGDVATAFTTLAWGEKSNAYKYATELLGAAPSLDDDFDLESLVDHECWITVIKQEGKDRTKVGGIQRVVREAPPPPPPAARARTRTAPAARPVPTQPPPAPAEEGEEFDEIAF